MVDRNLATHYNLERAQSDNYTNSLSVQFIINVEKFWSYFLYGVQ